MKLWEKADLMDYDDLKRLSEKELRSYARSAVNEARKRRADLERSGLAPYSEAYQTTVKGGKLGSGQFTLAKKQSPADLRKELRRSLSFLNAKTSTLEGAGRRKKWYGEVLGTDDPERITQFLTLYNELFWSPKTDSAASLSGKFAKYTGQFQKSMILVKVLWRYMDQGLETVEQKLEEIGRKLNEAERKAGIS